MANEGQQLSPLFDKGRAEQAHYHESDIPFYCGNPFIEALPPIREREEVVTALCYYPSKDERERALPTSIRHEMVGVASMFFQPLEMHVDLERQVSRTIRFGYV